jgi:hypothetical protein
LILLVIGLILLIAGVVLVLLVARLADYGTCTRNAESRRVDPATLPGNRFPCRET